MHKSHGFQIIHFKRSAVGGFQELAAGRTAGGNASIPTTSTSTAVSPTTLSSLYSLDLSLLLALLTLAFLFFISPKIVSWLSSGRWSQGWSLGSASFHGPRESEWGFGGGGVGYAREGRRVGWLGASLKHLYNTTLLRPVPFIDLTVGQVCVGAIYIGLVMLAIFYRAGDIRTNWKRPGFISVAQIPVVFLLSTKNNFLSLVGKGYEKLNFLHRLAGRMLILCGLLHTGLYFKVKGTLSPSVVNYSEPVIYTGVVAILGLVLILVTSVGPSRRMAYQMFLLSHIIGWLTFIIAVNFHVPLIARPYTVVALGAYAFDRLVRLLQTRIKSASLTPLSGGMTMLQVDGINSGWRAGQHVWIRVGEGRGSWTEPHPFTVGNAPKDSSILPGHHNLTLMAKSRRDWTRRINELATQSSVEKSYAFEKQGFGSGKTVKVALEGPYGGLMYTDFADAEAVLLIAGGSGVTFVASILEELISLASEGNSRNRLITLVWSMKVVECADWYSEYMNALVEVARLRTRLQLRLRLHVTGPHPSSTSPITSATLSSSRPDIPTILNGVMDTIINSLPAGTGNGRGGGIAVGVCGPKQLVKQVRKAVGGVPRGKTMRAGGIDVHSETFGW